MKPYKDKTGTMARLRAQQGLYLIRRENLQQRMVHLKYLIKSNNSKLQMVSTEIRKVVYGPLTDKEI